MKRLFSVLVALLMTMGLCFSFAACGGKTNNDKEQFETYKTEQCEYFDSLEGDDADNTVKVLVMQAKNAVKAIVWTDGKPLEEQKTAVDEVVAEWAAKIRYETAVIGDYAADGRFKQDYFVEMDKTEEGQPSSLMTLICSLISDVQLREELLAATTSGDYYVTSQIFFKADGSVTLFNRYTELAKKFWARISPTADVVTSGEEKVFGTYTIDMQTDSERTNTVTLTPASGDALTFKLDVGSGNVIGNRLFDDEIYKKNDALSEPQRTIDDLLTPDGYIKKNAVDASKADYYLLTDSSVSLSSAAAANVNALTDSTLKARMLAVKKAGDIYKESIVSFTESGKVVLTNHYTELGAAYMAAQGKNIPSTRDEVLEGTYTVSRTATEGTGEYPVTVTLKDGSSMAFALKLSGEIIRSDLFTAEEFAGFTTNDIIANSGFGYTEVAWNEGVDGTSYLNVSYADKMVNSENKGVAEREVLDVYVPANLDTTKENGVLLFIHGGSWISGSKDDCANLCKEYAKQGYITAALSHTYAMTDLGDGVTSTLYTIDDEVDAAMAKIKEMSAANGWNITKSALWGGSSGCHIAFLYAYGKGNETTAPLPVAFVSGIVGLLDFRAEYCTHVQTYGPGVAALGLADEKICYANPEGSTNFVTDYSEDEYNAKIDSISPLAFAKRGDAVPTIAGYAYLDDNLIDWCFAGELKSVLDEQGIENWTVTLPNSGHICGNNPEYMRWFKEQLSAYLQKYFN